MGRLFCLLVPGFPPVCCGQITSPASSAGCAQSCRQSMWRWGPCLRVLPSSPRGAPGTEGHCRGVSCWVQGQESRRKQFWGNKSVPQAGESLLWLPGLAWPWVPVQLLPTDKAGGSGWGNFSALKHWEGSCAVLGCSLAGPRATTPHLPRAQHAVGSGDAPQGANPRQGVSSSSSSSVPFSSSCPAAEQQTGGSVPPRPWAGPL